MSDREKRKRDRARRQAAHLAGKFAPVERVCHALGLPDGFTGAKWLRDAVIARRVPPPEVVLHPEAVGQLGADDLRAEIEASLHAIPVPTHPRLTAAEFFSAGATLWVYTRLMTPDEMASYPRSVRESVIPAAARVAEFHAANVTEVLGAVAVRADILSAEYTSIMDGLFWPATEFVPCSLGNVALRVTVRYAPPVRRDVAIGGETRPAYRCGGAYQSNDLRWVEWDGTALGLGRPGPFSVFVQKHAMLRACERAPIQNPQLVMDGMFTSLLNPEVADRLGDDLLVKYTLLGCHLGYLVATVAGDIVVVRTFLFLTMQGTPEARKLSERLGLRRADIEYLKLDRLDTFLHSDLRLDEELTSAFDDCGCGHLLKVWKPEVRECWQRGRAHELRAYLRMGRPRNGPGEAGR